MTGNRKAICRWARKTARAGCRLQGGFNSYQGCLLPLIIVLGIMVSGCSPNANVPGGEAPVIELTEKFTPVEPVRPESFERHLPVVRQGQRRDAMVLIAPVAVNTSLQGASGEVMLEGWAAPVFNVGDGLQMDLFLVRDGRHELLGSRFFDAARKAEDRKWIRIAWTFKLGGNENLEIRVTAGPQGDQSADWLALSSLRLLQKGKGK